MQLDPKLWIWLVAHRDNTERDAVLAMRAVQLSLWHWPITVRARWVRLLFLTWRWQLWARFAHHGFYLPRVPRIHLRAVLWPHQHGSIAESRCFQSSTTAFDHCRCQDRYNICGHRNITPMTMGFIHNTCSSTKSFLYRRLKNAQQAASPVRAATMFALCAHSLAIDETLPTLLHPAHRCFPQNYHNKYGSDETSNAEYTQIKKSKFIQEIRKLNENKDSDHTQHFHTALTATTHII